MNELSIITLSGENITDFAETRNIELAKAKSDWVFFVDSDEKITPELKKEILEVKRPTKRPNGKLSKIHLIIPPTLTLFD